MEGEWAIMSHPNGAIASFLSGLLCMANESLWAIRMEPFTASWIWRWMCHSNGACYGDSVPKYVCMHLSLRNKGFLLVYSPNMRACYGERISHYEPSEWGHLQFLEYGDEYAIRMELVMEMNVPSEWQCPEICVYASVYGFVYGSSLLWKRMSNWELLEWSCLELSW